MTITTLSTPAGTNEISLQSFRDSAHMGPMLHVVHDGHAWKVEALPTTMGERSGGCKEIEVDTTSVFVAGLGRAFSPGIQAAVVRELGLVPRPGESLESAAVLQAIAMAETSHKALEGVDFMTRLMFSAAIHGTGFTQVCAALGLPPEAVGAQQRTAIDARLQNRFDEAAQQGQTPVAPALARQWLQAELSALKLTLDPL